VSQILTSSTGLGGQNIFQVNSSAGAMTLTLPSITTSGLTHIISDIGGQLSIYPITIITTSPNTILNSYTGILMNINYSSYTFVSNQSIGITGGTWLIT